MNGLDEAQACFMMISIILCLKSMLAMQAMEWKIKSSAVPIVVDLRTMSDIELQRSCKPHPTIFPSIPSIENLPAELQQQWQNLRSDAKKADKLSRWGRELQDPFILLLLLLLFSGAMSNSQSTVCHMLSSQTDATACNDKRYGSGRAMKSLVKHTIRIVCHVCCTDERTRCR